jgi:hypothetical protein
MPLQVESAAAVLAAAMHHRSYHVAVVMTAQVSKRAPMARFS